jgi:hypothetical protein
MEIFVDFGLFELLAALGVSALAKKIYSRRLFQIPFLIATVGLPAVLIFVVTSEEARWLAAGCLATALVNVSVVLGALQKGEVPTLTLPHRRQSTSTAKSVQ